MKMSLIVAAASMLGLTTGVSPMGGAHAAELRVLAGGSLRSVLTELGPKFEQASGHKLVIHFDTTPNLIKAATTGEPFDSASCRSTFSMTPTQRPISRRRSNLHASAMASRSVRRAEAGHQHASGLQEDAARRKIHHISAGKRGRLLYSEAFRAARHRRRDEGQDRRTGSTDRNCSGRGQRRRGDWRCS